MYAPCYYDPDSQISYCYPVKPVIQPVVVGYELPGLINQPLRYIKPLKTPESLEESVEDQQQVPAVVCDSPCEIYELNRVYPKNKARKELNQGLNQPESKQKQEEEDECDVNWSKQIREGRHAQRKHFPEKNSFNNCILRHYEHVPNRPCSYPHCIVCKK